jgi:hypothetical protein
MVWEPKAVLVHASSELCLVGPAPEVDIAGGFRVLPPRPVRCFPQILPGMISDSFPFFLP